MAWACSGKTNVELVNNMLNAGLFKSELVGEALRRVDRVNYVRNKHDAYYDSPQSIGHAATISAPHMARLSIQWNHEHLLPLLKPGAKVLDVGSGSGYTCAIFHHLVNPTGSEGGKVVGIDHISELVDWSADNLKRDGLGAYISNGAIKMVCGDGRLVGPDGGAQYIYQVDKDESGNVKEEKLFGVRRAESMYY
ncbi:unnamed protein product [Rhizoctonia solani]|uniref:protein-L-isoaspartate(D-aspartate) O-methyltransferase n=1 Tax=Rhizoctonia solani TaxID=456999 RepID=A0A8H2XMX4_9AGAM|nr:unnamed protein product [Rhizoctonia solani]